MNNLTMQELQESKKLLTVSMGVCGYFDHLQFIGYAFSGGVTDFWAFLDTSDNKVLYLKRDLIVSIAEE